MRPSGRGLAELFGRSWRDVAAAGACVTTVQLALGHSSPTITLNTCTHDVA